jgi:small redox-active disulfide protein 2
MSQTAIYNTTVAWKGEHWGHLVMGNGPEMDFSAPPDAQGHPGVFTPEDAFVAAANTCIMMMFIWAVERFKLNLLSYECRAEGTKLVELDRTEIFTHLRFWPVIRIAAGNEAPSVVEARTRRALQAAQKYSLVANSVKSEIIIEPNIEIINHQLSEEVLAMEIVIKVLGSGCENCQKVEEVARQVVTNLGVDARVEHITDYAGIHKYPILATPGLVINEKLVCAGRIPTLAEVTTWMTNAMETV